MPAFFLEICQDGFRALVLAGVFAGLLFSCGEGIRLFPFPALETAQNNSSKLKSPAELNYQKNLHRFESKRESYQSKSQRDKPARHWTDVYKASDTQSLINTLAGRKNDVWSRRPLFKSRFISALLGSRAPPAF